MKDTIKIGLNDIKGKPICGGDILHIKEFDNKAFSNNGLRSDKNIQNALGVEGLKGKLLMEYNTSVDWYCGGFWLSEIWEHDMPLRCLYGDMKKSNPILEFEIIGNINDDPELIKKR